MNKLCLNCYYGVISSWNFIFAGTQPSGCGFTKDGQTQNEAHLLKAKEKKKMNLRKYHPLFLFFVITFLMVGVLGGCREEPNLGQTAENLDDESKNELDERPIQQIFDYRLVETKAGIRSWVLDSDLMNKYSGQRDVELITVHIDFYKEGAHFSTLTADSGLANLQTNNIFTWGEVVVVTEDGRKLETEELYFDNTTRLIHNDVFDRFTRDGDIVEGIGLEATPDLEYIEIKQRVEASVLDTEQPKGESR